MTTGKNRNDRETELTRAEKKKLMKAKKSDLSPEMRRVQRKLLLKRKKKRRTIALVIEIVILLILLAGIWFWNKVNKIDFQGSMKNVETNQLDSKTKEMLSGYTTIAVFGLDNRTVGTYKEGRSDTILIASINNDTKQVSLVSVLRDSYLDIDGKNTLDKANAAYAKGGPEQAVNMLNRNLDLDIEDYVVVDFKAVADAVDAVGGVEITVDAETAKGMMWCWEECEQVVGRKSTPVQASDQPQLLDGVQALCYARTRHTSGDDFRRASRQREVVDQVVKKAKKASISQLNKMINTIFPEISTSLSATELIGLATGMKDYTISQSIGFPFTLTTATVSKSGSVVIPCTLESNVKQLYQILYGDENYEPSTGVQERSAYIEKKTGKTEKDGNLYGYNGLTDEQKAAIEGDGSSTNEENSSQKSQ
jgi:LCP family protein required for cell wall assembly